MMQHVVQGVSHFVGGRIQLLPFVKGRGVGVKMELGFRLAQWVKRRWTNNGAMEQWQTKKCTAKGNILQK